jgi:hypothetical protein
MPRIFGHRAQPRQSGHQTTVTDELTLGALGFIASSLDLQTKLFERVLVLSLTEALCRDGRF